MRGVSKTVFECSKCGGDGGDCGDNTAQMRLFTRKINLDSEIESNSEIESCVMQDIAHLAKGNGDSPASSPFRTTACYFPRCGFLFKMRRAAWAASTTSSHSELLIYSSSVASVPV